MVDSEPELVRDVLPVSRKIDGVRAVVDNPTLWGPLDFEREPAASAGWGDAELLNLLTQSYADLDQSMGATKRAFLDWRDKAWDTQSRNEMRLRGLFWAWREAKTDADRTTCADIARRAWGLFACPETRADEDQSVRHVIQVPARSRLIAKDSDGGKMAKGAR